MSDSAQYDTQGRIWITGEILTKIEHILIHYSVAQEGLKYEENRSKISLDCPFK